MPPHKPDSAMMPREAGREPPEIRFSGTGSAVSFEVMLNGLQDARVVYVGESHTLQEHHEFQLRVIQGLRARGRNLVVGLEMFDRSYQAVLDRWTAGELGEEDFLRAVHWYANWRYDFALYREILSALRRDGIRIVALNLPAHIPPKIRVGGIDHLSAHEKGFLPHQIDTTDAGHRAFVQKVFSQHDFKGRTRFEDFYLAQCVWEDGMAESAAAALDGHAATLVVLAGNGHIQYKYGIPARAFRRNALAYRTVVQLAPGEPWAAEIADYVVLPN